MLLKNIILCFILFITLMNSISPKKENPLFNPISFLSEQRKMISLLSEPNVINIKCLYSKDYNIYSLQALQNKDADYNTEDEEGNPILFNFCQNTVTGEDLESTVVKQVNDTLIRLAGSIDGDGEEKNKWSEYGGDTDDKGIQIELTQGDECKDGAHYQTIIKIKCNPDIDKIDDIKFEFSDTGDCTYMLYFESLYGCTLGSSYLFLKLLNDYNIVFCIIFVIIGVMLCFMGNKFLKVAIIITSGLIGCYCITAGVLYLFPDFIVSEISLIVCLLVCFILGCIVGFFLKNEVKPTVVILGGFLGYSLVTFVYQIVQTYIEYDPQILYYACLIGCILFGAVLGYCLSDPILIIGTAVFGGYLAMRGVSLVAKNYLDEALVIDLIKNKEWEELKELRSGWIYAYLGIWGLLAVVGIIVQCVNKNKNKNGNNYSKM